MKKILLGLTLLSCQTTLAIADDTDVLPIATVNQDRQSITVEIENFTNFDIYCERISTQVIYRSSTTENNLDETIHSRSIWIPKGTTSRFTDGRTNTSRLRKIYQDAYIDVVKNDSVAISANVKCSYQEFKPMLGKLASHGSWIAGASTRRDGRILATVGSDQSVKLWNTSNGNLVKELKFSSTSLQVLFSESDDMMYVFQNDLGIITKYDAISFDPIFEVKIDRISNLAEAIISKDGRRIATDTDSGVHVIDTVTGNFILLPNSKLPPDSYNQGRMKFNPNSDRLAYLAYDFGNDSVRYKLKVLDLSNFPRYQEIDTLNLNNADKDLKPGFVSWTTDGKALIVSAPGKNGEGFMQRRNYSGSTLIGAEEIRLDAIMGLPLPNGNVAFIQAIKFDSNPVKLWNPEKDDISYDATNLVWWNSPLLQIPGSQKFLVVNYDAMIIDPNNGQVQATFELSGTPIAARDIAKAKYIYSRSDEDIFITLLPPESF